MQLTAAGILAFMAAAGILLPAIAGIAIWAARKGLEAHEKKAPDSCRGELVNRKTDAPPES
mgnify:CR=1 FL=1